MFEITLLPNCFLKLSLFTCTFIHMFQLAAMLHKTVHTHTRAAIIIQSNFHWLWLWYERLKFPCTAVSRVYTECGNPVRGGSGRICRLKTPCWWNSSEKNSQIGLSWQEGYGNSNNHITLNPDGWGYNIRRPFQDPLISGKNQNEKLTQAHLDSIWLEQYPIRNTTRYLSSLQMITWGKCVL